MARGLFRRAAAADPVLVDARRGLRMVEHKIARRVPRSGEPALVRSGRFALSFAIALVSIAAALVQTSSVLASSS